MNIEPTLDLQPVFASSRVATNMPFFDGTTLVFCQSTGTTNVFIPTTGTIWKRIRQNKVLAEQMKNLPRNQQIAFRPWKLAYCNWNDKTVSTIATGLPCNMTERSPAFYRDGDRIHLSFISGGPTSAGFRYRLYRCSGADLGHLDAPQPVSNLPLYFGFVSPHHVCWGMMNVVQLSEKATGSSFRLRTSFYRVACVNFLANDPAKLLITGLLDREHRFQTILYDLATGNVSDVSVGGPVYKSSMHGKQLVFTERRNDGFENRALCHGEYSLSPSTIQISKER